MSSAPHCRSIRSNSGAAMRSRPAAGPWPEIRIVSVRTPEILDKLEQHPIWKERVEAKARGQNADILVGTGVACATKDYGTGGDGTLGSVEIDPGGRITIRCDYVEMGTGIGTAVANRVAAHLGAVAGEIALAQVDTFGPLALVTSGDSYTI